MPSVSEGKTCETCGDLGSKVEGIDKKLDYSSDEISCVNEEEIFSE